MITVRDDRVFRFGASARRAKKRRTSSRRTTKRTTSSYGYGRALDSSHAASALSARSAAFLHRRVPLLTISMSGMSKFPRTNFTWSSGYPAM